MINASDYKVGDFVMKGGKPFVAAGWVNGVYEQQTVKRLTNQPNGLAAWERVRVADAKAELEKFDAASKAATLSSISEPVVAAPVPTVATPTTVTVKEPAAPPKPFAKAIARLSGEAARPTDTWSKSIARLTPKQEQTRGK